LLTAALALPPEDGLRRWTYHTLFRLIAVTGMRISEAMGLERDDVDLDAGVLTVRLIKFGKSRLVPLHPTTRTALRNYADRRDARLGSRCGSTFFVAEQGGRLLHQYVHRVFWRLSREIVPGHACTTSVIISATGLFRQLILAEQMLDAAALRELLSKKWEGPSPSAQGSRT
jgi:integrase